MSNSQIIEDIVSKIKMSDSPAHKKACPLSELQMFDEIFPILLEDLGKNGMSDKNIIDAREWFQKVCEYNVPFGKKNRGMTVVQSFKYVAPDEVTPDNIKLARILGWCVEWLQAFFLVADDIMDHSLTRRGQICWYKKPNVGLIAINDAFFLESAIYVLLKKYFKGKPYYVNILELFHETTLQTIIGQNLDLTTASDTHVDFTNYTMDRYRAIVKWKTAFYSFYLPVAIALYMAGIDDPETHDHAKVILLQMGEFFQIQDDYLDCYGDPEVIGKIGTDIQDNKCGWLVIQALSQCSQKQKQILQDNYAQDDPTKISKVKALYEELGLKKLYEEYEEHSYADLLILIDQFSGPLPKEMFLAYARKIYKRLK